MSGDQTVAGMRRYLAEVVGEFAAMEFDRMLDEARREALIDACDAIAVLISERGIHLFPALDAVAALARERP